MRRIFPLVIRQVDIFYLQSAEDPNNSIQFDLDEILSDLLKWDDPNDGLLTSGLIDEMSKDTEDKDPQNEPQIGIKNDFVTKTPENQTMETIDLTALNIDQNTNSKKINKTSDVEIKKSSKLKEGIMHVEKPIQDDIVCTIAEPQLNNNSQQEVSIDGIPASKFLPNLNESGSQSNSMIPNSFSTPDQDSIQSTEVVNDVTLLKKELRLDQLFSASAVRKHLTVPEIEKYIEILSKCLNVLRFLHRKKTGVELPPYKDTTFMNPPHQFLKIFKYSDDSEKKEIDNKETKTEDDQ